jgi:type VI secretion system secreted protein Hcp
MAVDAFIWFEPAISDMMQPAGETKDSKYSKTTPNPAFEIKDFSFGVENPTTIGSATGGAGAGKIKFNEFTIKKSSDKASPAFFKNCCAGAHYSTVTIEMRKAGGDPGTSGKGFMRFKFDTVFTTKIDWSGPGDEAPEETITFVYGKLGVMYWEQTAEGKQGQQWPAGWDQVQNIDASGWAGDPGTSIG